MKLWSKTSTTTTEKIEQFTVGNDRTFDLRMAAFDVEGSIAHVTMLGEQGLMTKENAETAVRALKEILENIIAGNFNIDPQVEDIHSQIEFMLTEKIGDVGKMIHTGRSRNDQVALDIKLFLRSQIKEIKEETIHLFDLFIKIIIFLFSSM